MGNGFLLLEGDDLYINYHNLNNAVDGDTVLVEVILYNGKKEGKVIRVLERDTKNIIGTIIFKKNKPFLELDEKKKKLTIEIDPNTLSGCVEGTKVVVNLVKENYEKFDKMLKDIDEEYRTTLINFAKYKLVMFAMAKFMEMETTERNKVALYLFNNIKT